MSWLCDQCDYNVCAQCLPTGVDPSAVGEASGEAESTEAETVSEETTKKENPDGSITTTLVITTKSGGQMKTETYTNTEFPS